MKISLNVKLLDGPYGGGMQFAHSLKNYLSERGMEVVTSLGDDDIDVIFHIAPFPFQEIYLYTYIDAYRYKILHPKTKIIERINECDERKNTHFMNWFLIDASRYADHIVFIASWLKPLLEGQGLSKEINSSVILNGADNSIFNSEGKVFWDSTKKMKIVTHHWGANSMKGHDIYLKLDSILSRKEFSDLFEFTFIGNIPKDAHYQNTRIVSPLSGKALASELKSHDIYITASRNEPAGMHHIEGALSGLPLLYIESGALPEYCSTYGIGFTEDTLEQRLIEIRNQYALFVKRLEEYPYTSNFMNEQYFQLLNKVMNQTSDVKVRNMSLLEFSFQQAKVFALSFAVRVTESVKARFL